jgi:hypothetical protein
VRDFFFTHNQAQASSVGVAVKDYDSRIRLQQSLDYPGADEAVRASNQESLTG